jgi:NitT/TauT family transport system substrate-binding protein/putative hydroxymethylpyrimidine transport system substrate-binding protein
MQRLLAICAIAAALAGCGTRHHQASSSTASRAPAARSATLVLDFTPNAIHAGIYAALAHGDDRAAGLRLHVIAPSASTDAIRLLETGRANFAILDIHDLAIARERGQPIVGFLPIVQRPLAAVIAQPSITTPRRLAGRTVGVTGDPSDTAVLNSIVSGASGGRLGSGSVHRITIGFNAVADLLAGRVAAATAFWNDEGVTLRQHRRGFHVFRVENYGAPAYPELVVCATAAQLARDPSLARGLVRALTAGYDTVLTDPATGIRALASRVPGLDSRLAAAELRGELPAFRGPGGRFGVLDRSRLNAWARWEARFGIVRTPPNVAKMFDFGLGATGRGAS